MIRAKDFITARAAAGRPYFAVSEAQAALGASMDTTRHALLRLAKNGLIARPANGFYVVVPPEYRSLGSLPADQFIPALMEHLKLRYYVGILSAAQYHGAAHHRPQEFQVVVAANRRPIQCGAVRVAFIARKHLDRVPVQSFNTPRGTIMVSSVEATAVDLVGYQHHAGGLDQVATLLSELAEQIDPEKLLAAALTAPLPWAQRLGYLLEHVGASDRVAPLREHVRRHVKNATPLLAGHPVERDHVSKDWRLYVNVEVEAEV